MFFKFTTLQYSGTIQMSLRSVENSPMCVHDMLDSTNQKIDQMQVFL